MSYTLAYTGAEIDALLGKIDAIFVAEYGSTIYSEVTAAIAAGNKVIVANAGKVYVYAGQDDNSGYVFTQSGPNAAKPNATYVTLSTGNVWSTATVDLATLQQFYASLMEDTASGSIASFPDGAEGVPVKELTADIEPIQDLHGQPFPYPDGGYKNKLAPTEYAATTSNGITFTPHEDDTISVSGTATGLAVFDIAMTQALANGSYILNGCPSGGGGSTFGLYVNSLTDTSLSNTIIDHGYGSGVFTISDSGIYRPRIIVRSGYAISGTLTFKPMIRLSTEADETFAPYSNICPITGYTGAEIPVTGINVWDEEWELGGISIVSGNPFSSNSRIRSKNFCPIKGGQNYYYKGTTHTTYLLFYRADESFISALTVNTSNVIAAPEDSHYFKLSPEASYGTTYNNDISINYPSTDTAYHSGADNTTYSVSWSDHGTIYKGTAEYKGGGEWEITPTHETVDLSTIAFTYNSAPADVRWVSNSGISSIYSASPNPASTPDAIAEQYEVMSINRQNGDTSLIGLALYNQKVACRNGSTTTPPSGLLLVPLRTPQTFTVTGPDPETLLGDNNIWSDTGDISVKYRCNTALYIEKKLGE